MGLGQGMNTSNQTSAFCGWASLVLPLIGGLVVLAVSAIFGTSPPDAVARTRMLIATACVVVGLIMGAVGLMRHEQPRWPSLVGTILCVFLIVASVIYVFFFAVDRRIAS